VVDYLNVRVVDNANVDRLKHEWGMLPLRVRRIERVRLHVDLSIVAQLATALAKARGAVTPLAA